MSDDDEGVTPEEADEIKLDAGDVKVSPIGDEQMSGKTFDLVLVGGTWRVPGVISEAELRELERAHEDGDIRAEETLRLLKGGVRRQGMEWPDGTVTAGYSAEAPPAGTWSNRFDGDQDRRNAERFAADLREAWPDPRIRAEPLETRIAAIARLPRR